MPSDDESIVGGGSGSAVVESTKIGGGRQRRKVKDPCRVYILVEKGVGGLWSSAFPDEQAAGEEQEDCVRGMVVAKVVASGLSSPTTSVLQERLRSLVLVESHRASVQGFLEYEILARFILDDPAALAQPMSDPATILASLSGLRGVSSVSTDPGATPNCRAAGDCCHEWNNAFQPMQPAAVVELAKGVADRAIEGGKHLHCVALTGKVNRKRLLSEGDASRKRLKRLREDLPQQEEPVPMVIAEKRWNGRFGVKDPDVMLQWLDCSQDLKQQALANIACKKFAKLLSKSSGVPEAKLLENAESVSASLLKLSRVRLDCAANLLHRAWWSEVSKLSDVSVHIFCDSSPQWRGVELFATTVDFVVDGVLHRRLAPLVSLNSAQLDRHGKLAALLWQAFLMVGPSFASMQDFCASVRSVTTDMGVERLLSDNGSCLGAFFATFDPEGMGLADSSGSGQWLFDRCLHMPGFRHMIDNIMQKALSSMQAFPGFLLKLKAIVKFLRNDLVIGELDRDFEEGGLHGLASVLRSAKLVTFAAWRWGTLASVCQALDKFLLSLADRFDGKAFEDRRDSSEVKQVLAAFKSPAWKRLFKFVSWYTEALTTLMDWVGGCPCHPPGPDQASRVDCWRKGRRLPEAHAKIKQVLGGMLAEANAWTPSSFENDVELWQDCQGCVRFTWALGLEKASFLDKVPYLLARLPEDCRKSKLVLQTHTMPIGARLYASHRTLGRTCSSSDHVSVLRRMRSSSETLQTSNVPSVCACRCRGRRPWATGVQRHLCAMHRWSDTHNWSGVDHMARFRQLCIVCGER